MDFNNEYEDDDIELACMALAAAPSVIGVCGAYYLQHLDEKPSRNRYLTSRRLGKQNRNAQAYIDAMSKVAKSMNRMAEAIKKRAAAEERRADVDPSELFGALQEIGDMNNNSLMYAFEYLLANEVKAKVFMTYPREMRKDYLDYLIRQFETPSE